MAINDPPPKKNQPLFSTAPAATAGSPAPSTPAVVAPAASAQPSTPAATSAPSGEWAAGGNLLPQSNQVPPQWSPSTGWRPQSAQDFVLQRLGELGQGAGDLAHGIYNYTRSGANYATAGGIDRALGLANQYLPAGTPTALRPNPYASQVDYTQQARNEMGPGLDTVAQIAGLSRLSRGLPEVGLPGVGSLAESVAGKSFLNPALQYGGYKAAESAIAGDDPKTIGVKGAEGFGEGSLFGMFANKVVSPAVRALVTKYYGGSTPEDVSQKLSQSATAATQTAAEQKAAADQLLNSLPLNRKDLGFGFEANKSVNPTYGDVQSMLQAGEGSPNPVPPILKQRINAAMQGPDVTQAQAANVAATSPSQQAAADAAMKAIHAEWLANAGRTTGLPGANVPAEATQILKQGGLTPEIQQAYTNIAQAGVPGRGAELWKTIGRLAGGGAGAFGAQEAGLPHLAPYAMLVGQEGGAELANKIAGPTGHAAIQQAIAKAWPVMTGEYPAAARGQAAAFNAIATLYGLK